MNIYGMLQAMARNLPPGSERAESLDLVDMLERQNAFGTVARHTTGSHRWTRESAFSPNCGLCGKKQEEHEQ